jgi:hypothetical protein
MPTSGKTFDTVRRRKERQSGKKADYDLLQRCWQAWNNLEEVRLARDRAKRYCYGDQWGDTVRVYKNGFYYDYTEREYLKKKGSVPLSNNVMVSILNTIVGLYAKQGTEPVCFARTRSSQSLSDMMSATMQCNWQNTQMEDLLKHVLEDYLIGGVVVCRETYEDREQEIDDSWTDYVEPNYVFWEGGSDPRHLDLSLIGVLHDVSREDLYKKFAKDEYGLDVNRLNRIFNIDPDDVSTEGTLHNDINDLSNISFDVPSRRGHCVRVIEVWTTETKYRYQCYDPIATNESDAYFRIECDDKALIAQLNAKNAERKRQYDLMGVPPEDRAYITSKKVADKYWYYTYMAPDGTVLCRGESPYDFKSHPFTVKLYPYVNGEIHPFMGNIIDQQRYINRLIIMNDMAIRSSAKGLMLVPTQVLDGMTPDQFAEQATEYDGMIFYTPKATLPNSRPDVITSNAVNLGTNELLQIELNLIREVSNVSGALQGKTPTAGTSASRYAQESQNASTSLYSILKDIESFTENVAQKKCMMIKQYYEDGRIIFNRDYTSTLEYDRMAARDIKFKISIKNAAATAAYQNNINDQLDKLLELGAINVVQYLQNLNAPFADRLLQDIQSQQAELEAQQAEMGQQAPQNGVVPGADQEAVERAQGYLMQ